MVSMTIGAQSGSQIDDRGALRAVVVGAGAAGVGHVRALKHVGVDVIAICGRRQDAVSTAARRCGVREASTDWERSVRTLSPDIVCIATPASLRGDVVRAACAQGCHVLCEKPLATSAREAKDLYRVVENTGIRHAYASTMRYSPVVRWLKCLLDRGVIGRLEDIHISLRSDGRRGVEWQWFDCLSFGGGVLNNHFVHMWGVLRTVLEAEPQWLVGSAHGLKGSARIERGGGANVDLERFYPGDRRHNKTTLPTMDADNVMSAILQYSPQMNGDPPITVHLSACNLAGNTWPPPGMYVNGEKGTLGIDLSSSSAESVWLRRSLQDDYEELAVPEQMRKSVPQIGLGLHNWWAALARDFVSDIRGQRHEPYLTFLDGWIIQEAVEAIRAQKGWHRVAPKSSRLRVRTDAGTHGGRM